MDIYDWDKVVRRRKKVQKGVWCFNCYIMKLYFNNEMKPLKKKGKQQIIDNQLYYDFNDDNYYGAKYYTLLGDII